MICKLYQGDCIRYLQSPDINGIDLTFLDPPFNQNKKYNSYHDNLPEKNYWKWMEEVCRLTNEKTTDGGSIYFMQREKNVDHVLETLETTGWKIQNVIVWKKKTSAVPIARGFGKHYQVIVFATKGPVPLVFHKLRVDPSPLPNEKYVRPKGMFVTDVWDDIRELTSGYFAGREPLRLSNGKRLHEQQSPRELLLRIILSSSNVGDLVFDPFAGTATTLIVAQQLHRDSIGAEIDSTYCKYAQQRLEELQPRDDIARLRHYYRFTQHLNFFWPTTPETRNQTAVVLEQQKIPYLSKSSTK